jgi:hypothetical protein
MLWNFYPTYLPQANPTNPPQFGLSQSKRAFCGRVEKKARMKRGVHTEWQEEKWKNEPGNKPSNGRRLFQDVKAKGCGDVDHTAYVLLRFRQQRRGSLVTASPYELIFREKRTHTVEPRLR